MKKISLVMPLIVISFLVSCANGGNNPDELKFMVTESEVTYDFTSKQITINLDWAPSDHSLELSDFTFKLENQTDMVDHITHGKVGDRPLPITITFKQDLTESDYGTLSFHYKDITTQSEGVGTVDGIHVLVSEVFFVTDSQPRYDSIDNKITVNLDWTLENHSFEFSNFTFKLENYSDIVNDITSGEIGARPLPITITFSKKLPSVDVGTLSFHYKDQTTGTEGEGKVGNINIIFPAQPKFSINNAMVSYDVASKTATMYLRWLPVNHEIEFDNDFTFTLSTQKTITSTVTAATSIAGQITLNVQFNEGLDLNDRGTLKFNYIDKTERIKDEGEINGIKIVIPKTYEVTCTEENVTLSNLEASTVEDYRTTISVNSDKINEGYTVPNKIDKIIVIYQTEEEPVEITNFRYIPNENDFSAKLTIPKSNIIGKITIYLEINKLTNLCFTSKKDNSTVSYNASGLTSADIDIEISYDGEDWQDWDMDAGGESEEVTLNEGEKLYIRNTKNTLSKGESSYFTFNMTVGSKIEASGNVNSMINYNSLTQYCFYGLFSECTSSLVSAPTLPATTLAENCYENMFKHCMLTTAPFLPATNLVSKCYSNMFSLCYKLDYLKVGFGTEDSQAWPENGATSGWLLDISTTGTFVWKGSEDGPEIRGNSTVLEGWSITTY